MMDDYLGRLREALSDRYSIEREIGRGGMATVYLAEEHHPRRKVAVKLLTPDISTRVLRERFLREVNLASTLMHPHIVPVFAAGEADDMLYFVMPYIEGESLAHRLGKGPVPLGEAVSITREVAGALNYAHGLGVVHRDIKPANILLTKDHAIVADFGIARALGVAGGESLTQAGLAIGTPAYMSPEQAAGLRDLDGRTDIYALGTVLLEMLGGVPRGNQTPEERVASVRSSIRAMTATHVTRQGVESVIAKAIAVDPIDRYKTAQEFRLALEDPDQVGSLAAPHKRAVGIGATVGGLAVLAALIGGLFLPERGGAATPERVVVALFENQTGDPGLAHIGWMASDWITQGLAQTGVLDVAVAREGLTAAAGGTQSEDTRLRALAAETESQIVVSGAYYRQGDSLRFLARITDPAQGVVLLSVSPVAAPLDDPLVGVEVLRQRVMGALATIVDNRLRASARAFSQPPRYDAYREYVQGMTEFMRINQPSAIRHFLRAAELDSTLASATIFAAFVYGTMALWTQADSLARIVERSSDELAPLDRSQLDWVLAIAGGDVDGGLVAMRAAAEISGAESHIMLAITAGWARRPQEALDALREVDPERGFARDFILYWNFVADALHALGRHREELAQAREGRRRLPDKRNVLMSEMRALATMGDSSILDSLWDLYDALPPQPQFALFTGDVMRLAALEARAHGHEMLAEATLERALQWYRALPANTLQQEGYRYGYARVLYATGAYQDAKALFGELARLQPDSVGYLGYVAAAAARLGDRNEAIRISEELRQSERPSSHGAVVFWRARIASTLGDHPGAMGYLRQSVVQGRRFQGDEHFMTDLQDMRDYPPFVQWLRPRG
ncbi:MAG: serine/threonine-protein kinase [Gemmatimonadetes bacterium]|nr:serine/threonine-protein kinase [Gemmatimonadota bacterium]